MADSRSLVFLSLSRAIDSGAVFTQVQFAICNVADFFTSQICNIFICVYHHSANPPSTQILAALLQRHRTGRGCWIDVAMTDWAFALMAMAQAKYLACGEAIGGGRDLLSGAVPCYDVYRTKDGHITVRPMIGALCVVFYSCHSCVVILLYDLFVSLMICDLVHFVIHAFVS